NPRISEWPMPRTDTPRLFPDAFRKQLKKVCGDFLNIRLTGGHYISVTGVEWDMCLKRNPYHPLVTLKP
ncbi:MAG: hypothetical protein IJ589_02265, partial [Lachnospiraceae bacterium]|nr:hypothetical protein [Lachnospiraceae bacterium]